MMSSVDALPVLMIDSSDALCPSTRTMLVCGGNPFSHMGDIVDVHHRAVDLTDRQIVQPLRW